MLVTDDGIVRLANDLHPSKAPLSMLVTDNGISRLVNEPHPKKAASPKLVTNDGIVTRVTFVLSTRHSFHARLHHPPNLLESQVE